MAEKTEQNTKRRDNPRFINKNKNNKGPKVIQTDLDDLSRLSTIIPEEIKMKVGSAIMAFSRMEMSATNFLWDILGLSIDDGKLFRVDTKDRFVMAKKLSERYGMPLHGNKQTTAEAWSAIDGIIEARNKMAHGVWHMVDGEVPIVVSYRISVEPGRVNSEMFDANRIDSVTGACINISRLFDDPCMQLAASSNRPVRQDLETTTSHPRHPAP